MKIIFKIAKNELRNLFYSPVAWFLAIVFFIQCAYFYMAALYPMAISQDWNLLYVQQWKDFGPSTSLTATHFFGPDGIINNVYQNLYLFVPLLTMGMISREINNGTIKLLYSSPIRPEHIILGKYLAVMIYNLMLIAILGFFMVSGGFQIKSIDYGWLLAALLGFYLLIGAYSAIGLFMSSLTTHQIVSAIATFTIFFILSRIGSLWQKYDFIRDLTWFLSIAGRTEKMLRGLITSKDVIYFLVITIMFLSFTLFRLKSQRESRPWTVAVLRYMSVIIVGILFGYIFSRPTMVAYLDATASKSNTIAPETQKILRKMGKEPLEITMYTNLWGGDFTRGLPEARNAYLDRLWEQYRRFKPDIRFKYVYYYDCDDDNRVFLHQTYPHKTLAQIAASQIRSLKLDSSMFLSPQEVRKLAEVKAENYSPLYMTVKYKGDTVNLRTYGDSKFWPDETEVASKIKRLVEGRIPYIYYLTGNLERSIHKTGEREYSNHSIDKSKRFALVNLGFNVDTLSLEQQDIPANATALVLADPKTQLPPIVLSKLRQYIDRGGNLLISGEPGKQAILNPFLVQIGVQLRNGQLVQLDKNETPDKIYPYMTEDYQTLLLDRGSELSKKQESKRADTMYTEMMVGAAALSYVENGRFIINPLLKTYKQGGWLKMGHLVTDSVAPVFSPEDGDINEPEFVTAVKLTRQINSRQQRIIVLGDADYMSNLRGGGGIFYTWLDYKDYPIPISNPTFKDNRLTITAGTARILKMVYIWILPGLLLAAGTILLIRRKRK